MAHKTLISGTAYEISGGKTLVGGTAYEIKNGKTLVGGTAYNIDLARMCTINIVKTSLERPHIAKVTINGQVYDGGAQATLELPIGTVVECYVTDQSTYTRSRVTLNDKTVFSEKGTYNYIVTKNASIKMNGYGVNEGSLYGRITITELN